MHVARAQISADDVLICDNFVGTAFGNFLPVVEHHDVAGNSHNRTHHVLNDDNRQPAFRQFPHQGNGLIDLRWVQPSHDLV